MDGSPATTWREVLLALALALLAAAWPLRQGLLEKGTILFGVDTATIQEPWEVSWRQQWVHNAELSDQGVVFYPAYVHVARRWLSGELPLWNPLLYAGAPLLANPQLGALDPQVLALVGLEAVGGRTLFDRGFAFLAWLRLAAAALGAYLLARELGLRRGGAALAAITFGGSGFLIVWLNHSLGHVAPFLPWVLLGVERARSWRGAAGAALALALAIYGGHPETAFYVGACAGVWSLAILRGDRTHGLRALTGLGLGTLLAAASLIPFAEYLARSGALVARQLIERPTPDLVALGALLVALGLAQGFRASLASHAGTWTLRDRLRGLGVGCLLLAAALLVRWEPTVGLLLAPDLMGSPVSQSEPWRGQGSFLETACAWIAAVPLALALAAVLSPTPDEGALRRRGVAAAIGMVALLLAVSTPGLRDVHAYLPLVGHGAIARLAVVSALLLGLLAGEALDAAPPPARLASVTLIGLLAALWPVGGASPVPPAPVDLGLDPPDGLVELVERPPEEVSAGRLSFGGWIHPGLPEATLVTQLRRWNGSDWVSGGHSLPTLSPSQAVELPPDAPEGARTWHAGSLDVRYFEPGLWRLTLELVAADGSVMGSRNLASTRVVRHRSWPAVSLALLLASLVLVLAAPARPGRLWLILLLGLPLAQSLRLAEGFHPVVASEDPEDLHEELPLCLDCMGVPHPMRFHLSETEQVLARELGPRRFLSDPGILPPSTGMVSGLRAADGYDALDPASFDAYRPYVLKPGVHPLLGFTASGADLDAPGFQLLGVGALVTHVPLRREGWRIAAQPGGGEGIERAEVYVQVPEDPPPRAFVVGRARRLADVAGSPAALVAAGFEPFEEALLEDPSKWQPTEPLRSWNVDGIDWDDERVAVRVRLEGDGLLVLTDQHFPGWQAEVDGEPREILAVDSIYRGVPLSGGEHEVVFSYRPASVRWGFALSALAVVATLLAAFRGRAATSA